MKLILKGEEHAEITSDAVVEIADCSNPTISIMPAYHEDEAAQTELSVDIMIGAGCKVNVVSIVGKKAKIVSRSTVGDNSVLRTSVLWLNGGEGNTTNLLEGRKSEAYDIQLFVGQGNEKLRLDSVLRHHGQDTKGNILIKGVVKDSASADLEGMIKIDKEGRGAESFLSEHAMLLSPNAHASADPKLEIENNDVSSRHSASVSQIDENKIFYMMSRGLGREDAKRLIIQGFFESATEMIRGSTALMDQIAESTSRKI